MRIFFTLVTALVIPGVRVFATQDFSNYTIPKDFIMGTGSSAYQVEGGWNEDGKGASIWDTFTHQHKDRILDGSDGDMAADSYHKYRLDVQMLKDMKVNMYRFSISWPRVIPTGFVNVVNQAGIDYYNSLINLLKENGIEPMVTLYHWDLPQPLQELGGWTNSIMVDYFEDFAHLAFSHFGDRVKWWITINEAENVATGYNITDKDMFAPGLDINGTGIAYYQVTHNLIKAHARAYHLYSKKFRHMQNGKVGAAFHTPWNEPFSEKPADEVAAEFENQFTVGLHAHPIYSSTGDYPPVIKAALERISKEQGFSRSRLPSFTLEEIEYIRGTFDFFGLNYYTSRLVTGPQDVRRYETERTLSYDPTWPNTTEPTMKVTPFGLRMILNWVKKEYDNATIFVTENGYAGGDYYDDPDRGKFIVRHLNEILKAMHEDHCHVIGYIYWSLIDSFEWTSGYTQRFGLVHVNYSDPDRKRMPKTSAKLYQEIIKSRVLPLSSLLETGEIKVIPKNESKHENVTEVSKNRGCVVRMLTTLLWMLVPVYILR